MNELDALMKEVNKKFKKEMVTQGRREYSEVRRVPFDNARLDYMTYGGLPVGKFMEFFGSEGGGKTTTAILAVRQFQKHFPNRKVLFVDAENTFDYDWAELHGVSTDDLLFIAPEEETAEEVLQIIEDFIETGHISLAILDSVPFLLPKQAMEKDYDEKTYAGNSAVMTKFASKICGILTRTDTTCIFINQVREDMNSRFNKIRTPGGRMLKHSYSVRLEFSKGRFFDDKGDEIPEYSENPIGNFVDIKVTKTKAFRPNRRIGSYKLNYIDGVDNLFDLIFVASQMGIIQQAGAWYRIIDPDTGEILIDPDTEEKMNFQGKSNFIDYLKENKDLLTEIKTVVYNKSLSEEVQTRNEQEAD